MDFLDYIAITFFVMLAFIAVVMFSGVFNGKGPSAGFAGIILAFFGAVVAAIAAVILAAGTLLT